MEQLLEARPVERSRTVASPSGEPCRVAAGEETEPRLLGVLCGCVLLRFRILDLLLSCSICTCWTFTSTSERLGWSVAR